MDIGDDSQNQLTQSSPYHVSYIRKARRILLAFLHVTNSLSWVAASLLMMVATTNTPSTFSCSGQSTSLLS